jgi:hypothetical protein
MSPSLFLEKTQNLKHKTGILYLRYWIFKTTEQDDLCYE